MRWSVDKRTRWALNSPGKHLHVHWSGGSIHEVEGKGSTHVRQLAYVEWADLNHAQRVFICEILLSQRRQRRRDSHDLRTRFIIFPAALPSSWNALTETLPTRNVADLPSIWPKKKNYNSVFSSNTSPSRPRPLLLNIRRDPMESLWAILNHIHFRLQFCSFCPFSIS